MKPRASTLSRLTHGGGPADLRRGLDLALLAREDAAGIDALSALVVTDVIADGEQARAELANLIHRLQGKQRAAASAPARSAPTVMPWVDRLMSWPPPQRTRALALLAAIDLPAGALAPWRDWELAHRPRIARAEASPRAAPLTTAARRPEDLGRVIAGIRARQAGAAPVHRAAPGPRRDRGAGRG